jgi:hypothetical protein
MIFISIYFYTSTYLPLLIVSMYSVHTPVLLLLLVVVVLYVLYSIIAIILGVV